MLTGTPGASAVVRGGLVVYATDLKHALAGVDAASARRARRGGPGRRRGNSPPVRGTRLGATWGIGLTGVAGPDPQDGHPVGTVFCAVAGPDGRAADDAARHSGDRDEVRTAAIRQAIRLLSRPIGNICPESRVDTLVIGASGSVTPHRYRCCTGPETTTVEAVRVDLGNSQPSNHVGTVREVAVLLRDALGETLRNARTRQNRTLRDVSTAANVSLGYLSEVERGRKEASSELLASICDALDVELAEVLSTVSQTMQADTGAKQAIITDKVATRSAVKGIDPSLRIVLPYQKDRTLSVG